MLIRDPREVVASYVRTRAAVAADDIGLPQQVRLYDELAAAGPAPPVIDAADFLRRPEPYLRALCDHAGVDFTDRMLSWPPGPRASDGVWGRHWYASVWASTGFAAYRPRDTPPRRPARRRRRGGPSALRPPPRAPLGAVTGASQRARQSSVTGRSASASTMPP